MKSFFLLLLVLFVFTSCVNPLGQKNKDQSTFDDGHVAFPVEVALEPFSLSSAVAGDTQVVLSWTTSENAKSYEVYYGTSSGNNSTKASMCSSTALTCTITGLINNQQYFFIVKSLNGLESLDSDNELSATPIPNDTAPVASNITPANGSEDTESTVVLSYVDGQGDQATSCNITALSNITITTPCACITGSCSVGVTGISNYSGAVSFSYTVTANGLTSNTATANFSLTAVNDAPTISDVADQTINEDASTSALAVTINDSDSTLTCASSISMASSNATLIGNTDVVFGGTAPNCTATLSPNAGESGSATITLTVTDGALTDTDTFVLNVVNVPVVEITSSPTINSSNVSAYILSGTCSEETRVVSINVGGITSTPSCISLIWTTTLDVSGISDGTISVTADHSDALGNNASQDSSSVSKDTIIPTVTITSSTPAINSTSSVSYTVSGACSENTEAVNVDVGGITSSPICMALSWSVTLDLSSLSANYGLLALSAAHSDVAGNDAIEATAQATADMGFKPSDLSGLRLWLESDDTTTLYQTSGCVTSSSQGEPVGCWTDKSGNSNNAVQLISGNRPIYNNSNFNGLAGLSFDGAGDGFDLTSSISGTRNIFAVESGHGYLFSGGAERIIPFFSTSSGMYWNSAPGITAVLAPWRNETSEQQSFFSLHSSGNYTVSTDATIRLSGTGTSGTNILTKIGLKWTGATSVPTWTGNISEIIIFNRIISTTERERIEGYLACKWNLQSSLPGLHPYKSTCP